MTSLDDSTFFGDLFLLVTLTSSLRSQNIYNVNRQHKFSILTKDELDPPNHLGVRGYTVGNTHTHTHYTHTHIKHT